MGDYGITGSCYSIPYFPTMKVIKIQLPLVGDNQYLAYTEDHSIHEMHSVNDLHKDIANYIRENGMKAYFTYELTKDEIQLVDIAEEQEW